MRFVPHIFDKSGNRIDVVIAPMKATDAARTDTEPKWQTSWASEYISSEAFDKYAVKLGDELIALGAYEILQSSVVVHIVYMEAHPESNPTIAGKNRKYFGIGRLLIAQGIKISIDNGLRGDVVLEAKTTELAEHYERDFGAVKLPIFSADASRFLIADDAAKNIFFSYLE